MKKVEIFFPIIVLLALFLFLVIYSRERLVLLFPAGTIARQQGSLIVTVVLLALSIIVPVVIALFVVALKYRSGKKDREHSDAYKKIKGIELFWWIAPSAIILIIAVITWNKTHALDPYNSLESNDAPVRVQVVALQWKWLFLYPEYNVASVNYLQLPENTPVNFELTSDGPMNSFWIPALSGQIYAMSGMSTKLHVEANRQGEFDGLAAEINGRGFSGMKFVAHVGTRGDFEKWLGAIKSERVLDMYEYEKLASPSENTPVTLYGSYDKDLYNKIMKKYQQPMSIERE